MNPPHWQQQQNVNVQMLVLSKPKLRPQHLLGDAGLLASPHTRLGYDRYGRRQVLMRYVDGTIYQRRRVRTKTNKLTRGFKMYNIQSRLLASPAYGFSRHTLSGA